MKNTLAIALLLVTSFTFGCQRASITPSAQAQSVAQSEATPKVRHYCNAETKKGTPCRHLVKKDGDRCFMHQGKPAMKDAK